MNNFWVLILTIFSGISSILLGLDKNEESGNSIIKVKMQVETEPFRVKLKVYSNLKLIHTSHTPINLELPKNYYTLIFSKKGYTEKKITIFLNENFKENISLEPDIFFVPESPEKKLPPKSDIKRDDKILSTNEIVEDVSKYTSEIKIGENLWDGQSNKSELSFDEALLYCSQKQKRLPSENELLESWKELKDYGWYFTNSQYPGKVLLVSLYTGRKMTFDKKDIKAYVRCIK